MGSKYEKKFLEMVKEIKEQDLKNLENIFNSKINYGLNILNSKNLIEQENKFQIDSLIKQLYQDKINIENNSININNIDYLLKRYISYLSKDEKISYYEEIKKEVLFSDKEVKEYLLIAGDFFGIQKFIFSDIDAKYASKVLRAKSAHIQIFTKIIAHYIVDRLKISSLHIITTSAGKFEILSPTINEDILRDIQNELNQFFINEYFGESGIGISWIKCKEDDFNKENYHKLRKKLSDKVEAKKFSKFDLRFITPIMKYNEDINNQNLCKFCNKRKGIERIDKNKSNEKYIACDRCENFIQIGKYLTTKRYIIFTKELKDTINIFRNYSIRFDVDIKKEDKPAIGIDDFLIFDISNEDNYNGFAKWELSSYVKHDEYGKIDTFNELAECSCNKCEHKEKQEGIEAIIALKADVDGMGNFIKESSVTDSFTKFNFFSRIVDYFFSVYVPYLMEKNHPNTYTIFAGGDDLFLVGAWDEIIELAKKVREDFEKFIQKRDDLSISMGLILTKPNKPINYISDIVEDALDRAKDFCCIKKDNKCQEPLKEKEKKCNDEKQSKDIRKKDAITLFGETVKWDYYIKIVEELNGFYNVSNDLNTSNLYSLLEISNMAIRVKYQIGNFSMRDTLWKSKLRYLFNRNIDKNHHNFIEILNRNLEEFPKETKIFLVEFIYKRRKM